MMMVGRGPRNMIGLIRVRLRRTTRKQ